MGQMAVKDRTTIARPLKVLVPLIRQELDAGERAGLEHYRLAGEMLIEAKEQMPYGNWGRWLAKSFKAADGSKLSERTARRYMRLAEIMKSDTTSATRGRSDYTVVIGERQPRIQTHANFRKVIDAARELDSDLFARERQTQDEEIRIRRELVSDLIDIGYKALATRLHPDRGGSKDAMVRLNDIRAQLIELAKTRRWI